MTSRATSDHPPTILIVDDHALTRRGLRCLIESDERWTVSGEAGGVATAWRQLERQQPDLLIVDVALPDGNGIEFVKQLRKRFPRLRMLVLSMHDETLYAERALRAGALGYVMKSSIDQVLVTAIETVLAGQRFLCPRLLARRLENPEVLGHSPKNVLSDRELEVFEWIGRGLATTPIAHKMHLSVKTIETHRAKIKLKLGIPTASELVRRAVAWVESGKAS